MSSPPKYEFIPRSPSTTKSGWASPSASIRPISPRFQTPISPTSSPGPLLGRHKDANFVKEEHNTPPQNEHRITRTQSTGNASQVKKDLSPIPITSYGNESTTSIELHEQKERSTKTHFPKFLSNSGIQVGLDFPFKAKSPRGKDNSDTSPVRRVHLSIDASRGGLISPEASPKGARQSAQLLPTSRNQDSSPTSPSTSPPRNLSPSKILTRKTSDSSLSDSMKITTQRESKLEKRNSESKLTNIVPKKTLAPPVRPQHSNNTPNPVLSFSQDGSKSKETQSSRPLSPVPSKPSDPSVLRQQVIDEIITTEKDYVNDLTYLVENYLTPLKYSNIAQPDQVMAIFSNAELILGVNKELLQNLEDASTSLGDAFLRMSPYFKMYSTYCNNRTKCLQTVASVKQSNKVFYEFIERVQSDKGKFFDDYLIKPVQRICKYPLFFREMLRYTDSSSPEHEKLEKVLGALNSVVDHVNESKRRQENMARAYEISVRIDVTHLNLLSASRQFLKESSIQYRAPDEKIHEYQLILFTDLIILAKIKRDKILCKTAVELRTGTEFRDLPDFADISLHNMVELVETKDLVKTKYKLSFSTSEEKKEWQEVVTALLNKSHS